MDLVRLLKKNRVNMVNSKAFNLLEYVDFVAILGQGWFQGFKGLLMAAM